MLFKRARMDGLVGRKGESGGQLGQGRRNLNPRPRSAIAWLLSHALSLAALSSSSIPPLLPLPLPPLLEGISYSLHPCPGFAARRSLHVSHTGRLSLTQDAGVIEEWGRGGLERELKARRGESVFPEGLTDIFSIQKLSSFCLIENVAA